MATKIKSNVTPVKVIKPKKSDEPYYVIIDVDEEDEDEDDGGYKDILENKVRIISRTAKRTVFEFSFIRENGPGCCGIFELHRFIEQGLNNKTIPENVMIKAVKDLFERVIKVGSKNTLSGEFRCLTYYLTTVDSTCCKFVDKVLADGELFTKVKTFKNPNSGAENRMYISNL